MWVRVSLLLNCIKKDLTIYSRFLIKIMKQCLPVYSPHELPNLLQAGAMQWARDARGRKLMLSTNC
jgi:hypothetical protein